MGYPKVYGDDHKFVTPQEQERIDAIWGRPGTDYPRKIYNAFVNGDWKRQNFYKPTSLKIAQIALYDSQSDTTYNTLIRRSLDEINLTKYFTNCPLPTLLIEGRWDLLFDANKPYQFHKQHPHAKLILMGNSNHHPFIDEQKLFFFHLKEFILSMPEIDNKQLSAWKKDMIKKHKQSISK